MASTFSRESPRRAHVVGDPGADAWERLGELQHVLEFRAVADFAPARVIAILLAALRVSAGRLDVTVRQAGRSKRPCRPAG